jgi:transposase
MKIFKEYNQSQPFLLPLSLDEFVPENHEARIIIDPCISNETRLYCNT